MLMMSITYILFITPFHQDKQPWKNNHFLWSFFSIVYLGHSSLKAV